MESKDNQTIPPVDVTNTNNEEPPKIKEEIAIEDNHHLLTEPPSQNQQRALSIQPDAAPSEVPSEVSKRMTKCVYCHQTMTHLSQPKLLECLHSACINCINTKIQENEQAEGDVVVTELECPECKVLTKNYIDNSFIFEFDETVPLPKESQKNADVKCSSCYDEAIAVSWCVDCAEFICESCVQAHQRLKITKEHTIKPKEDADVEAQNSSISSVPRNVSCISHPQEHLTLYCEVCQKLTCRDCQLTEHREHKYKFVHELAAESRDFITGLLREVTYKRSLLNSAMKVIDERDDLITGKKRSLANEVTALVVRLNKAINNRGKLLVMKMCEVCDMKQKVLKDKKAALEDLKSLTDHCIDFVTNMLDNGSDLSLLMSKNTVITHLQKIKSRRADIPNPDIPVRIEILHDHVAELEKLIDMYGSVLVDGKSCFKTELCETASAKKSVEPSPSPRTGVPVTYVPIRPSQPADANSTLQAQSQVQMRAPSPKMEFELRPRKRSLNNSVRMNNFEQSLLSPSLVQIYPRSGSPSTRIKHQRTVNIRTTLGQQQYHFNSQLSNNLHPQISISPVPQLLAGGGAQLMPHQISLIRNNTQQVVTSSTHPGTDPNIRNLLQSPVAPNVHDIIVPNGQVYQNTQVKNYQFPTNQFLPPQFLAQEFTNMKAAIAASGNFNTSRPTPRTQQQPPPPYTQPAPQWHIPQQDNFIQAKPTTLMSIPIDESFKIHLKTQNITVSNTLTFNSNVTSSVPKTPSPTTQKDDTNSRLDKLCQESVTDLMATIAKLDSNGIEVIPERTKQRAEHLVDSSTAGYLNQPITKRSEAQKDDSNEDWCAVCMDGGKLICCDNCPKVFHVECHIPPLATFPEENETWQCMLCSDVANLPDTEKKTKRRNALSFQHRKIAERIVLELFCQFELSAHFRNSQPYSLDAIRLKLNPEHESHYTALPQLVKDIRLVFHSQKMMNNKDSPIYKDAISLEEIFESLLIRWLPDFTFDNVDLEEETVMPPRKCKKIVIEDSEDDD